MTIPENILIAIGVTLIFSLMANAVFIGLLVAYVNSERDERECLYHERMKEKRK